MSSALYDFQELQYIFTYKDCREKFEKIITDCSEILENEKRLYFLEFHTFINTIVIYYRGPHITRLTLKKYQYNFYDTYILIKYISLPEMSKRLLNEFMGRDFLDPVTIYEIHNNDFFQTFFSLDEYTPVQDTVKSLNLLVQSNSLSSLRNTIYEFYGKIHSMITYYFVLRARLKIIYFVTQNIIFDKHNFASDFVHRYRFTAHVAKIYNFNIFAPAYVSREFTRNLFHESVLEFKSQPDLKMTIRRIFCDYFSTYTFSGFARKLDADLLADFTIPNYKQRHNKFVYEKFIEKELYMKTVYSEYLKMYSLLTSNILARQTQPTDKNYELENEFTILISMVKNNIPYESQALEKLGEFVA